MHLLGLSPARIFSGFETAFFDAVEAQGASIRRVQLEVPWFKALTTLVSVRPSRSAWGNRRDRLYHTTITAFRLKSAAAQRCVARYADAIDAVYQVGALWAPIPRGLDVPLVLHVDYTSALSRRRGTGWKRSPGREQAFWLDQEQRLYDTAAIILTTTENARRSLLEDYGVPPERVTTVGAGVRAPYDRLEPDRLPAYDSRRALFVGRGVEGKGLDTLLEAFRRVRSRIPDARLTVIGPASPPAKQPGVDFLGRIEDRERLRDLFHEHAVFVMPSRFEPFGQVFLEAMACQLPCIGTTVDAMPEIIEHDRTGYLVAPGDADALATHLIDLLGTPDRAQELGRRGFEKLERHFTWPVVGCRIKREIEAWIVRRSSLRHALSTTH